MKEAISNKHGSGQQKDPMPSPNQSERDSVRERVTEILNLPFAGPEPEFAMRDDKNEVPIRDIQVDRILELITTSKREAYLLGKLHERQPVDPDFVSEREREARIDELKQAKKIVQKQHPIFLRKDPTDPVGEKVVKVRNQLRREIVAELDERLAELEPDKKAS